MVRKSDSSIFLAKDGEEFQEKSKINRSTIATVAVYLCLIGMGIIGTIAVMEIMKGNVTKIFITISMPHITKIGTAFFSSVRSTSSENADYCLGIGDRGQRSQRFFERSEHHSDLRLVICD